MGWCYGNAVDLCFGDACFESWLGYWPSKVRVCVVFLSPSKQMLR